MKTNNKVNAYILRGSTAALLFSCVIVVLCSAINLPEQPPKALPPQDNAAYGANGHRSQTLSFADRVTYQRAIEEVYWRHRIWPKERPDSKPSLDAVMSQATIEKKVQDYLRNSELLEQDWSKPITLEQLQAEMDRMAQHSKQPEVLRELFEALGNDPFVIAECLARPAVAERLVTNLSCNDRDPFHTSRASAENQMAKLITAVSPNYKLPTMSGAPNGCTNDTWTATSTTNAPSPRDGYPAVWTAP